jgi:Amt family ammonium transporter
MGWFGFNAGSALTAGSIATSAVASTQIAACCSGMVWLTISWIRDKPSCIALINGVIAGLAGITPASGYISSQASIIVGIILGITSYISVIIIKHKLQIDDALDVSSIHGITGIIGSLSIGFCSQKSLNSQGADGLFFGNPRLLALQTLGVVVVIIYSAIITWILYKILDKLIGLKIQLEEEEIGLDIIEHGEYAYHNLWLAGTEPQYEKIYSEEKRPLILNHDN